MLFTGLGLTWEFEGGMVSLVTNPRKHGLFLALTSIRGVLFRVREETLFLF